jgi:hypothetical protein
MAPSPGGRHRTDRPDADDDGMEEPFTNLARVIGQARDSDQRLIVEVVKALESQLRERDRRIAELQDEARRAVEQEAQRLRDELTAAREELKRASASAGSTEPVEEFREELEQQAPSRVALPASVASAYVEIASHLDQAEDSERLGQIQQALAARAVAASRACRVLTQLCRDDQFLEKLEAVGEPAGRDAAKSRRLLEEDKFGEFRQKEVELLTTAGLSPRYADELIDVCRSAFLETADSGQTEPILGLQQLEQLREATCDAATGLFRKARQRVRRRRFRIVFVGGIGGTLLVIANVSASALITPAGAAASSALGGAGMNEALKEILAWEQ